MMGNYINQDAYILKAKPIWIVFDYQNQKKYEQNMTVSQTSVKFKNKVKFYSRAMVTFSKKQIL